MSTVFDFRLKIMTFIGDLDLELQDRVTDSEKHLTEANIKLKVNAYLPRDDEDMERTPN